MPMSGLTALMALRDVKARCSAAKLLITGAGGGIGTFAVQIAKTLGAEVTGVCSTSKVDLVRSIGADHVIDYTKGDFTLLGERYDFVLDNVLKHSLTQLLRAVTPKGMLVPNGGQFYKRWFARVGVILIRLLCSPWSSPSESARSAAAAARGPARPTEAPRIREDHTVIDRTYPLSQTPQAIDDFAEGHVRGKVAIIV